MSRKTVERDAETGTDTTGHEWDGIRELDTPLPRWWLWTFYATVLWGLAYTVAYPAWPLIDSATRGVLGYSSRAELAAEVAAHEAASAGTLDRIAASGFEEIAADPALDAYALAGGAALFRTHCSQCHGAGAAGAHGYPNLLDDDWLWGGTAEDIHATVSHGVRWDENADTRFSLMPNFGADGILARGEIEAVADHVLALGAGVPAGLPGKSLFADNCAACHGEDGTGNRDLGAPDLTDAIWLYGGDRGSIVAQLARSRHGVMPAWGGRLSEADLKQVAHYVHSLGGGE